MATNSTQSSKSCSKVDRKDYMDCEPTPQFVVTIDFGTTHCSVAYLLRPDLEPIPSEVVPTVLKLDNDGNRRVPSCILFDPNGKKIAFGPEARDKYVALNRKLRPCYYYFEHVKKDLQQEEVMHLTTELPCSNAAINVKPHPPPIAGEWVWQGGVFN